MLELVDRINLRFIDYIIKVQVLFRIEKKFLIYIILNKTLHSLTNYF